MARNHGMKYALGKYLSFLDADDYFAPDLLERLYCNAEKDEANIVICRYKELCENTGDIRNIDWSFIDSFFVKKKRFFGEDLNYAGIFQISRGWAWDKLFETDFVRRSEYKFPDFRSSEDGFFVYMLLISAQTISYIDDVLITHRINNENSLSNTREKDWLNGFKMLLTIWNEIKRLNLYEVYEQSFLNEVPNFMMWYLNSTQDFGTFKSCYMYMQMVLEPEIHVLNHERDYYFQKELFDWYQRVISLLLEEYLFQEQKEKTELLNQERKQISKVYAEKGWIFPYHLIEKGKTLVLYGAGKIGKCYYSQLIDSQFCKEVVWVDKHYEKCVDTGRMVKNPEVISTLKYDYIFLAVKDEQLQREIKEWLSRKGVRPDQIRCYGQNER